MYQGTRRKDLNIELSSIIEEIVEDQLPNDLTKEDLEKIANKASNSFLGVLSSDEVEVCILNAFWKAYKKYDPSAGTKFTTYFYNGVVMECLSQKKFNLNYPYMRIHDNIVSAPYRDVERIDMLDEVSSSCEDPQLIFDRFYKNMTVKEIALSRGVCSETIRIKINKNLTKLKRKLTQKSV